MHVPEGGNFRVLVVDDEPIIADTLKHILIACGFAARATYNGENALKLAEEWPPSALISDVMMPGMSGIDTARAMRALHPNCSILLFTGHGTPGILQRARENGFEILAKPVHPKELLDRLTVLRDGNC